MNNPGYTLILATTPDFEMARLIAIALVSDSLAACCSIIPKVTSIYKWEGNIDEQTECQLLIKSRIEIKDKIIDKIKSIHSYDVPEIIFLPFTSGNPDYLRWIDESVNQAL
jgi:periplasmic divalent cation tolerance protein